MVTEIVRENKAPFITNGLNNLERKILEKIPHNNILTYIHVVLWTTVNQDIHKLQFYFATTIL